MGLLSDLSVLVPWRSQDPQRIKVWDYVKWEWETFTDAEVCVGVDAEDGPFNTAKACNDAFKKSTKPYLLTWGADCIPDDLVVDYALQKMKKENLSWIAPFDKTIYYNERNTNKILEDKRWWDAEWDKALDVPFQTGIMLIRRDLYLETGGHDERFEGWGGEDAAFRRSVHILGGDSTPVPYTLRCLWHDPGRRGTMSKNNYALCHQYDNTHTREGMLNLIEQRGRYV